MASHATGDGGIPPRDAAKSGLKRIMTLGGAYGTHNYTAKDLRGQKGKRVLVETLPFTPEEAAAAEEAGIDTMKVRFDPKRPELAAEIRKAAPNTFMSFSVPLVAAASESEAVRLAYHAMELGGRCHHVPMVTTIHQRGRGSRRAGSGPCGLGAKKEHLDRGLARGRQNAR